MKNITFLFSLIFVFSFSKNSNAQCVTSETVNFSYTGSLQSWTVPDGVNSVTLTAVGASGGNFETQNGTVRQGGKGARVICDFPLPPGVKLQIIVGGRGEDHPGPAEMKFLGGGGGGATYIGFGDFGYVNFINDNLLLAAGAGGGAGSLSDAGDSMVLTMNNIAVGGLAGSVPNSSGGGATNNANGGSNFSQVDAGGHAAIIGADGGSSGALNPFGSTIDGGYGGGGGAGDSGGGGGGFGGGSGGQIPGLPGFPGTSRNYGINQVFNPGVNSGNGSVTISYTRSFIDTTDPIITCPADVMIAADANSCIATGVNLGSPTVTDDCTGVTFTDNAPATFPLGTTIVTYTATDTSGNTATCSQTVTVEDNVDPVISCPAAITVSNKPGDCGAIVTYPIPTVMDNCNANTAIETFNFTGSIENFVIPAFVTNISIEVRGAEGGNNTSSGLTAGKGAILTGDFNVTPGDMLKILVGQHNNSGNNGGGGSFVTLSDDTPLLIAGGGGGSGNTFGGSARHGQVGIAGGASGSGRPGGDNGNGGSACGVCVGAGGGLLTNGADGEFTGNGGKAFVNGGAGGGVNGQNFGGGGFGSGNAAGAGGGGYSGGGGSSTNRQGVGGGGGSFNAGSNQTSVTGDVDGNSGNGVVIISYERVTITQTAGLESGNAFPVGTTTNTFTATDLAGNTATCSFDVIVEDTEAPIASCATPFTIQLDGNGDASILAEAIDGGSTDNCGIDITTIPSAPTFLQTTLAGGSASQGNMFDVRAVNNIIINSFDVQINGGSGDFEVYYKTGSYLGSENNAADWTQVATIPGVSNIGLPTPLNLDLAIHVPAGNTVAFYVTTNRTGGVGYTVGTNEGALFASDTNLEFFEGIGKSYPFASNFRPRIFNGRIRYSIPQNRVDFNCSNIGANNIQLVVVDTNGNSSTCTTIVTVEDNVPPVAVCENITIQLDANGNTSIVAADIDGGSNDVCGIASLSVDIDSFDCSNVGPNNVTLTVTDVNGNSSTCTAVVTVEDSLPPVAVCQDITLQLDAAGNASIVAADVDGGSTDTCEIASLSVDIDTFDCSNVGSNNVTLTITDVNGNSSSCTALVTVEDTITPTALCQNITVQLDIDGNASISASDINDGSTDACGIDTLSIDVNSFDCSNVGPNNVILTVTDVNGNSSSCTTVVTVEDNVAPIAVCQDITIQLDANGDASILAADVDGGSFDTCGTVSTSIDTTDFTCADVGPNNVILTVTDVNGNSSYCTAVVTVEDNIDPIAVCMDITVQLDANGDANIVASDVDGGSNDVCGIASLSVDIDTFDCSNVGPNNVTLTVTDVNGNSSSCVAIVTVQDTIDPLMNCPADFTVGTDIGICGATVSFADPIPIDTCGIASLVQTAGLPSGSVFPVGSNVIEYTATDVNGNTTSCSFTITVVDDEAPTAVCMDITIQLDAAGNATILPTDVDGGSTDNCAMDTLSIDINTFSCADIGTNNVVLTVTDTAGNTATCTAIVTVEDLTPPTVVCQDITVTLDATGVVIIDPSLLDGGSTDACGGLFTYSATPDTFTCAEIGDNSVTLTVTEAHGNSASCEAIVTVVDNTPPILVCQDITVPLGANGMVSIVASDVIASVDDACGISATGLDIDDFSCDDLGIPVTVTVFASDVNGNLVSCTAIVTVVDELGPQFDQGSLPEDQVRMADGNGEYILEDFTTNVMVTDNCSVRNAAIVLTQDPVVGTVLTVGVYDITLSVEDDFGNMASYVFELEVVAPLGVGENNFDSASLTMYPNPATDFVLLSNPQNIPLKEVSIYDVTGRLIKKVDASATTSEVRLDVSELASATYMILINTEAGQVIKQLVKE
ncbi:HYR domain-containing protein [Rasiella sp. SM2506]|uniref:HYR domain-containing protein n=1 Tax=Rasiella sp. SM2506 TaxID=3423914 RepID=UPI003D7AC269